MKCFRLVGCLDIGHKKTQRTTPADDMATQTITDWENLTLDLKQRGSCASPLSLQTLSLTTKGNATFTLIREHNFGPLSSSSLAERAQATCFWCSLLFKSGLKPMSCIHLCMVALEVLTPFSLWISPTFLNWFSFTILCRLQASLLLHFLGLLIPSLLY